MNQAELKTRIDSCGHVIIKIGTATIRPHLNATDDSFFTDLANEVQKLHAARKKVVIVSSGAVGLGRAVMQQAGHLEKEKLLTVREKQALASIGQGLLVTLYRKAFEKAGIVTSQVLVAKSDFQENGHYQNLKSTIEQLLGWGVVPVVNENDAVATDELKLGDNDTLSSHIAGIYSDSLLVLLTSIDGFYIDQKRVEHIEEITREHFRHAGAPSEGGIGGMFTKIKAARNILLSGQVMVIASGKEPGILSDIIRGESCGTWFYHSQKNRLVSKKRWILRNNHIRSSVTVDKGAERALTGQRASLLMVGITAFSRNFEAGDIIEIQNEAGAVIAKGIASNDSKSLDAVISGKATNVAGELVHIDNLVVL